MVLFLVKLDFMNVNNVDFESKKIQNCTLPYLTQLAALLFYILVHWHHTNYNTALSRYFKQNFTPIVRIPCCDFTRIFPYISYIPMVYIYAISECTIFLFSQKKKTVASENLGNIHSRYMGVHTQLLTTLSREFSRKFKLLF